MVKAVTHNSHTGWHYLLSKVGVCFSVLGGWNYKNRNLPVNFNLISIEDVNWKEVNVLLVHRMLSDLPLILKAGIKRKRIIMVFHGRKSRQTEKLYRKIIKYSYFAFFDFFIKKLFDIKYVFITPCVKESWGRVGEVILPGIDLNDFIVERKLNEKPTIAIVGNNLKRSHFKYELIDVIAETGLNVKLIGAGNECLKGSQNISIVQPLCFDDYLNEIGSCKYYFSLLSEPEEGFNLGLLEAMAVGLPVIALNHPTSPVRHNVNGFVFFDDVSLLNVLSSTLSISDEEYERLSTNAMNTISLCFPLSEYVMKWNKVLAND